MIFDVKKGDFSRFGAKKMGSGVNFCFVAAKGLDCSILLYDRKNPKIVTKVPVPAIFSVGNVRAILIEKLCMDNFDYNYEIEGKVQNDPYARSFIGRECYGDIKRPKDFLGRCRLNTKPFDWKGDCAPEVERKDMVLYKLHIRGFTMASSIQRELRGTFAGLTKKLSYLKNLGITTIELMPVYEFEEVVRKEQKKIPNYLHWKQKKNDKIKQEMHTKEEEKINYWGYGKGMYFTPKASYSSGDNAAKELKECILNMHRNGMECILEMYFAEGETPNRILEVLRFWVEEYHVDGFHLQGINLPIWQILKDSFLAGIKLFYTGFPEEVYVSEDLKHRLFVDTDEFIYPCRKLVNHMGGSLEEYLNQMKKQNEQVGYINYIADNNGFTLADLFMYSKKHNEANGEDNMDGPQWNVSSNCGVEGPSNGRNIGKIRSQRMKNAAAMLFLSQGVPMLMAGDESCNTQMGNNNAYCQDNEIGWKDWKKGKAAQEFLNYMTKLIEFRREHPILRQEVPMQMADYKSCGCPDLSYHGENAWISPQVGRRSEIGVLFCGQYDKDTEDIYVAFNFSEFEEELALPKFALPRKWYLCMCTDRKDSFLNEPEELLERKINVPAASICIIIGKQEVGVDIKNESITAFEDDSAPQKSGA